MNKQLYKYLIKNNLDFGLDHNIGHWNTRLSIQANRGLGS